MTESTLRSQFREAIGEPDVPADLRHQTRLALRQLADSQPARFRWIPGAIAAILTVAVIGGFLAVGAYWRTHTAPASSGPSVACSELVSSGSAAHGDLTKAAFLFINGSSAACTVTAPTISLIGSAGTALDVPQDEAPGAREGMHLAAHRAVAIPYSITSLECSQTLRYGYMTATFSSGQSIRIEVAGETCPGSRITISPPIPAQICANGTFAWAVPGQPGLKSSC
jgi:hypothetical protein